MSTIWPETPSVMEPADRPPATVCTASSTVCTASGAVYAASSTSLGEDPQRFVRFERA